MWKLLLSLLLLSCDYSRTKLDSSEPSYSSESSILSEKYEADEIIKEDLAASAPRCGSQGDYNVTTDICCNGTIQRRSYGPRTGCCETNIYHTGNQTCCRPENRIIQKQLLCTMCNGKALDRRKFLCCQNNERWRIHGPNSTCCGKQVIDRRKTRCCHDKFVTPLSLSCGTCGGKPYDTANELCCQKKLILWKIFQGNSVCCGQKLIERTKVKCCADQYVFPLSKICEKCAGREYDSINNLCCQNKTVRWKVFGNNTLCCGMNVLNNETFKCCGNQIAFEKSVPCTACGGKFYDSRSSICCNNQTLRPLLDTKHTSCCGSEIYNTSSEQCCPGNVIVSKLRDCPVCGATPYDPKTFNCCNKILRRRVYSVHTKCCGTDVYSSITHKCCPSSVTIPVLAACPRCGAITYNPSSQKCCASRVLHPFTYGNRTQCCAADIYDNRVNRCCLGGILRSLAAPCPRCGGNPFNPRTSICCVGRVLHQRAYGGRTKCCGSVVYDDVQNRCCQPGNRLIAKSLNCSRCGGTPYDTSKFICCLGTLHQREASTQCCGSAIYDSRTRFCCSADVIVSNLNDCPKCGGVPINPGIFACCGDLAILPLTYGNHTRCCGMEILDNRTSNCCLGNIIIPKSSKCPTCNGVPYNSRNATCCQGTTIRPRPYGVYTECCGTTTFDRRLSRCCQGNKVMRKTRPCSGVCGGKLFNQQNFICCRNELLHFRRYGNDTQCCGQEIIDSKGKKCCFGRFIVHTNFNCGPRTPATCGGSELLSEIHICCDNTVRHVREFGNLTACCGRNKTYNTAIQKCCPGLDIILPKNDSCIPCGGQHINLLTQTCCGGKVVHPLTYSHFTTCCGANRIFDYRTSKCCPDKTVVLKTKPCLRSCGRVLYDSSRKICCAGRVVYNAIHGRKTACCGNSGVFHNQLQKCCFGYKIIPIGSSCIPCGNVYFNHGTHLCCAGKHMFYKKHGRHSSCCGTSIYNSYSQRCCSGHKIVPKYSTCKPFKCGAHYYMKPGHICCGNYKSFYRKYGIHTRCCSSGNHHSVYHKRTQKCCHGKPIPLLQNCLRQSACGPIDVTKFLCCSGHRVFKMFGPGTQCCDVTAYQPLLQLCCSGTPALRLGGRAARCCGQQSYDSRTSKCCPGIRVVTKRTSCS